MLVMLLAFALSDNDPAPAPPATVPCQARLENVRTAPVSTRMHPLSEEPAAQGYRPVLRLENGCSVPVKISERRIGNPPLR